MDGCYRGNRQRSKKTQQAQLPSPHKKHQPLSQSSQFFYQQQHQPKHHPEAAYQFHSSSVSEQQGFLVARQQKFISCQGDYPEEFNPGVMSSPTESSSHHHQKLQQQKILTFPHFPPPPDYPPPYTGHGSTDITIRSRGANTQPPAGALPLSPTNQNDMVLPVGIVGRKLTHRHHENLDAIEVWEPIMQAEKISKSKSSNPGDSSNSFLQNLHQSNAISNYNTAGSSCSSRSGSSHGNSLLEPRIKCSRNTNKIAKEVIAKETLLSLFPDAISTSTLPAPPHRHLEPETIQNHYTLPASGALHQDYSYAYYEPGAAMRHSNIPLPEHQMQPGPSRPPPPNSIRALLSKGKKNKQLVSPAVRQQFQTRYGPRENFYEEIACESSSTRLPITCSSVVPGHSTASINQSMVEEEFRRVQNRHRKILGELNLSVEVMLMPETPPNGNPTENENDEAPVVAGSLCKCSENVLEVLNTVQSTNEPLSPACSSTNPAFCGDLDSGFSGSSGASYIGSLRYHKTNAALANIVTARRTIAQNRSGDTSSFYSGSCRSSQRTTCGLSSPLAYPKINAHFKVNGRSNEDQVTPPRQTESKARSFWIKKGWRKISGFSSTSSVNQAGVDELKLNSGAWEDSLSTPSRLSATANTKTVQIHDDSLTADTLNDSTTRQSHPHHSSLSSRPNQQHIMPFHHQKTAHQSPINEHLRPQQATGHKILEQTPSACTINSSEDSWSSQRSGKHDDDLLSEGEDDISEHNDSSSTWQQKQLQRNSQLRSTFYKAKQHLSFDKWRLTGNGGANSGNQLHQQQQASATLLPSSAKPPGAAQNHPHPAPTSPGESPGGRLSRWFSIRRGSTNQYDVQGRDGRNSTSPGIITTKNMTSDAPVEDVAFDDTLYSIDLPDFSHSKPNNASGRSHNIFVTPAVPSASGLSEQQLTRQHVLVAIAHSESSYVATLQRLVNDYKTPLEESSPPILSSSKISILFHLLPEILLFHKVFEKTLSDCAENRNCDEKLGDVFLAAFSKPQVLEIYSGFINNFSAAMKLAKSEAKRKSALSDFFKVKQISANDRQSFFGLMVKPVQRFPQFILFLQDLLKYTPQGHHDRMSLQLALTQLESLAEILNERKREAEQYEAFKDMLGHISGTLNTRNLMSYTSDAKRQRYILRGDNVTQMEFNQAGFIIKTKKRRLLLLNDKVICVSVSPKQSLDFGATEKLSYKWMYPLSDMEIVDNSTSATLSRILTAGMNRGGSLKSCSSHGNDMIPGLATGAENLCTEMNSLMHDYEIISRINDLAGSLKDRYKELNTDITRTLLSSIQTSIQKKNEEMSWLDLCCLQLCARNKSGKEEIFTFQTENPSVKKEWITELRLAQLALDVSNSPAWEVPEHDQRPSTKMPLFVTAKPVHKSQHQTEVLCGCYYSIANDKRVSTDRKRLKNQCYLWISTRDGSSSHITVLSQHHQQTGLLKDFGSFDLSETQVTTIEFVKGLHENNAEGCLSLIGDLIWMGTDTRKILIYSARNPDQHEQLEMCLVPGAVTQILYHLDSVFVSLSNGCLLIFRRAYDGIWKLKEPQTVEIAKDIPITSFLPIDYSLYIGCEHRVHVLNAISGEVTKSFKVQHGNMQEVQLMAHSGIGLWISLKNSSIIRLYHTETFIHLQDINIASSVLRMKDSGKESVNNRFVYVTALMASKGLLWVGTNVGIAVTIPLPRLEGVPIINGGVSISYHAHFGPITFLLPLVQKTYPIFKPPLLAATDQTIVTSEDRTTKRQAKESTLQNDGHKIEDLEDSSVVLRNKNLNITTSYCGQTLPTGLVEAKNYSDLAMPSKLRAQSSNSPMLRRKRFKEITDFCRRSKTLPRGLGSANFFANSSFQQTEHGHCDVYGLYGKLIFVKEDYDTNKNSQSNLMDNMYESLRRSEPELAAISGKVCTLDRRLKMKASRPRSLDLSNWSVDSRSSSLFTLSGSEESMGLRIFAGRSVSRNSSSASHKATGNVSNLGNISENGALISSKRNTVNEMVIGELKTPRSKANASLRQAWLLESPVSTQSVTQSPSARIDSTTATNTISAKVGTSLKKKSKANKPNSDVANEPRTLITIMGGRGYWRHVWYKTLSPKNGSPSNSGESSMSRVANSNDAHIVVWEKKL